MINYVNDILINNYSWLFIVVFACAPLAAADHLQIEGQDSFLERKELIGHLGERQAQREQALRNIRTILPRELNEKIAGYVKGNNQFKNLIARFCLPIIARKLPHVGLHKMLALSSNGEYIASHCSHDQFRVWHVPVVKLVHRLVQTPSSYVSSVAWSPDCNRITAASWDGRIRIWDINKLFDSNDVLRRLSVNEFPIVNKINRALVDPEAITPLDDAEAITLSRNENLRQLLKPFVRITTSQKLLDAAVKNPVFMAGIKIIQNLNTDEAYTADLQTASLAQLEAYLATLESYIAKLKDTLEIQDTVVYNDAMHNKIARTIEKIEQRKASIKAVVINER